MNLKFALSGVILSGFQVSGLHAATLVWQGGTGDIFGAANWTKDGVPDQSHPFYSSGANNTQISFGTVTRNATGNVNVGTDDSMTINGTGAFTATTSFSLSSGAGLFSLSDSGMWKPALNFSINSTVAGTATMSGTSIMETAFLSIGTGTGSATRGVFNFGSGIITLSDPDALRSPQGFNGNMNWTGAAGAGQLITTDNSASLSTLARKVAQGFFAIDGVLISPVADGSNVSALNAELASGTWTQGGRYFQLTQLSGDDLSLALVPEPGSTALLGMAGLLMLRRKRG